MTSTLRCSRRTALKISATAATAVVAASLGACSLWPRATVVPMKTLIQPGPCRPRAPVLLVMLPGAYSLPDEFVTEGFVDATRRQGVAADIVIADSHLGYFYDRSVLTRLREDVIAPARAQGYRRIWLVGISLGGFGALAYAARQRAGDAAVDGVVALAPYLGQRRLLREIADAGGPRAWRAAARPQGDDDLEFELWQWLAARAEAAAPGAASIATPALPIYLGFGREDRLVEGHRLLATLLPPDRVTEVPGGHDWPPWRALWQQWLGRGLLSMDCGSHGA